MKLFNHIIEAKLSALCNWTHFKIHRHEYYSHLVWGRLSIIYGQPHLEPITLCALCDSHNVGERSAGEEGWTVCDDCAAIEQGTYEVTMEEWESR